MGKRFCYGDTNRNWYYLAWFLLISKPNNKSKVLVSRILLSSHAKESNNAVNFCKKKNCCDYYVAVRVPGP